MNAKYTIDREQSAIWRVRGNEAHVATWNLQSWDKSDLQPHEVKETTGNYWRPITRRQAARIFRNLFK